MPVALLECHENTCKFCYVDGNCRSTAIGIYVQLQEGRLPLPEGTCVNSCGCQGRGIGISFSKCAGEYAVAWRDLEDPGVASELLGGVRPCIL
eukprot:1154030-Pelagomonas_calceolata.AAC.3